jgi:hypothetical protein
MLEPFGIRIQFGTENEFDPEESGRIIQQIERETGRRPQRPLHYYIKADGRSVLQARQERINTRHLPPIRKFLRDFACGILDVQPVDTGYRGIQKLVFPIEGQEYWAFLIIDEAQTVEILEVGGERLSTPGARGFQARGRA